MWWVNQLLTPFGYLRISQGNGWYNSKKFYDFVLPILLSMLISPLFLLLPRPPIIFLNGGLLDSIQGLVQLLAAFFIAALAAIASFQGEYLDKILDGEPASIKKWDNDAQEYLDKILTRREFLCYLFGYLSILSIFLYLTIIFSKIAAPNLAYWISWSHHYFIRCVFVFIFFVIFINLIITTMIGLYFLTSKLPSGSK